MRRIGCSVMLFLLLAGTGWAMQTETLETVRIREAVEKARAEDRGTIVMLALLCGVGLILPLPLVLFHARRVRRLTDEILRLRDLLLERDKALVMVEQLRSRNEKLESELKHTLEKHRSALKAAQDRYDYANETIDRLKKDVQKIELENKRLSGILLLKEKEKKS